MVYGILALLVFFMVWGFIEARNVQWILTQYKNPRIPPAFDGVTVCFLTDLHYGTQVSLSRIRALVQKVNSTAPDLIVLGGDLVDTDASRILPLCGALSKLEAPMGVYRVVGNHDIMTGVRDRMTEDFKTVNITTLVNNWATLTRNGQTIGLCGLDDLNLGMPNVKNATAGAPDFSIVLSHNPDMVEQLTPKHENQFFMLAGHTHGGQITLFGKRAIFNSNKLGEKYRTGQKRFGGTDVLISNGFGTTGLPFRFFARPQVHFIQLKAVVDE